MCTLQKCHIRLHFDEVQCATGLEKIKQVRISYEIHILNFLNAYF